MSSCSEELCFLKIVLQGNISRYIRFTNNHQRTFLTPIIMDHESEKSSYDETARISVFLSLMLREVAVEHLQPLWSAVQT